MADNALTTEDIIIELKTNFAEEIPRMLTQYTGFVTKTGNISRSLERSVNLMMKTVSTSVRDMFGSSAKEVVNSMQQVRGLMTQIANQGIKTNEFYIKTFDKLTETQNKFQSEIKKTEDAISALRKTERLTSTPVKQRHIAGEKANKLETEKKALMAQLEAESIKITDEFNRRLGSMAAQTSKNFVKTAETNLQSVKSVVQDIGKQLNMVEGRLGLQTDLSKIFSMQKVFKDMQGQHASLQTALKNQSKLTLDAEKQMLIAKEALNNSVNEKIKQKNQENFQKTLENQLKVKKTYNELEKEVYSYGKALDGTENKINAMAMALQKSIKAGIKPTEVTNQMKKAFSLLIEEAQLAGKRMGDALVGNMDKSKKAEVTLLSTIQKLKEMRIEALQLQKTGLVDTSSEVRKIDLILNKYNAFFSEFKRQQAMVRNLLGQQKGLQIDTRTSDLNKVRKTYNELSQEVQKYGNIQANSIVEAHDKVKKLQSLWDQYLAKFRQVTERKKALQSEMHKVELAMAQTTNAQLVNELEKYYKKLQAKMQGVKATLSQAYEPPSTIKNTFKNIEVAAKTAQEKIKRTFLDNNDYLRKSFNDIKGEFDGLFKKMDKLSQRRFISNDAITHMQKAFTDTKLKAEEYEKQLVRIREAIKRLEEIQRKGLGGRGIQIQTEQLKKYASEMQRNIKNLNSDAARAQSAVGALHKKTLKSVVTNTWEMIRNFRWQVAAVIYLVTNAVNAVKRTFFDIINEAMEFRKNAMSIASSVSYQMMGDMEQNFKKAYKFSRQLMTQLEMEAARTILELEDMMMLTKTFSQAGIIPETKDDVRRISTIGTAIKALTEGMANAGVQMRQELYSIIAGRQRAVDQLAMMFKMLGIDINKVITDAKKEGVSMIVALSDALEPFEEMNKMMEKEYATVVNQLKVIWGMIKRLAAEPVMEILAAQFQKVADSLYDANQKVLTAFGEDVVKSLRSVLVLLMESGRSLFEIFKSVSIFIADIVNLFFPVKQSVDGMNNGFSEANSRLSAVVTTSQLLAKALLEIELIIHDITKVLGAVVNTISVIRNGVWDIVKIASFGVRGIFKGEFSDIKQQMEGMKGRFTDLKKSYEDVWNISDNRLKRTDELKASLDTIFNSINNISDELDKIDTKWKLPNNIEGLAEQAAKWGKKKDELTKQSLEGPAKFKYEYEMSVKENDEFRTQLQENLKKRSEDFEKYGHELTDKQKKQVKDQLKYWREALNDIAEVDKAAKAKMLKQNADYYQKAGEQAARARNEAEQFLIQISDKPESEMDKVHKWYDKTKEKLLELAVTNKYVANEIKTYWDALDEGYLRRQEQAMRKLGEEYEAFVEKITSHRVLNQFEAIDNEMNKLNNAINEAINLTNEHKNELTELVEVAREERKEFEKTTLAYQNRMKTFDLLSAKAAYMQGAYSPQVQQEGEILGLYANYMKAGNEIQQQLMDIDKLYKDQDGNWTRQGKEMQEYSQLLKDEFRLIQEAFERDLWRKQNPMWNELIDMSKSWSDSIADSLTDLVLDFENFGDSIKKVWESILRDTVKVVIQKKMMDPLMNALGSGEPGSPTLYQKMTGKEAIGMGASLFGKMSDDTKKQMSVLDQLVGSGQAIPVYIVDSPFLTDLPNSINKTTNAIVDAGRNTDNSIKEGFRNNGSILSQLVSAFWTSRTGQVASGIGSAIMGAIGSMAGGGMNTGAPAHIGVGGTTAFGMANGGTISEHIVGKGLSSGRIYEFGERSKYGEFEDVIPREKMHRQPAGQSVTMSMPININAIDSQSGVDFILKNQKLIEANMLRSIKNNKAIRGMIRQSW